MHRNGNMAVIDAKCGAGKSYKMKYFIACSWEKQKYIVAVPTIEMQNQTERDLVKDGVKGVKVINSEGGVTVGERLAQYMMPSSVYRVLIVTHQALLNLGERILMDRSYGKYLKDFVVFCDEIPNAIISAIVDVSVEENHQDWLKSVDNSDSDKMIGSNIGQLQSFYRERDSGTDSLKDLVWMLSAGYPGYKRKNKGTGYKVAVFAHSPIMEVIKCSSMFYLMGANASQSPFVYIAENWCGIEVVEPHYLLRIERIRNEHLNQERVTVHAVVKGRASLQKITESKHIRIPDNPMSDVSMFEEICRQTRMLLRGDYLFATNKDRIGCEFEKIANRVLGEWGVRIPYVSHGLNIYGGYEVHKISDSELASVYGQHEVPKYRNGFSKAAWLAVSRFSQDTKGYLKLLCDMKGGDGEKLIKLCEDFMMAEAAYQMTLRTKLRNPEDNSPIELVFIDEYTMNYFVDNYYPRAKIGSVGLVEFEKKGGKAERTKAEVQHWKEQGLNQKEVAAVTGKGLRTVQTHWASCEDEEMEGYPF